MSGQSGSEQIEIASWRPGAAECRNKRHRARLASRRAGDRAHRDIERGKLVQSTIKTTAAVSSDDTQAAKQAPYWGIATPPFSTQTSSVAVPHTAARC